MTVLAGPSQTPTIIQEPNPAPHAKLGSTRFARLRTANRANHCFCSNIRPLSTPAISARKFTAACRHSSSFEISPPSSASSVQPHPRPPASFMLRRLQRRTRLHHGGRHSLSAHCHGARCITTTTAATTTTALRAHPPPMTRGTPTPTTRGLLVIGSRASNATSPLVGWVICAGCIIIVLDLASYL
jgi:hypothetical protein